jgi:predicted kinase
MIYSSPTSALPLLVVVAGPPAAGKTTLARRLAAALRWPLIGKDTLKEALFDHLGAGDRERSQQLGYAVICAMYALAREILAAGASLILESTFIHPQTPAELRQLAGAAGARLAVVYCYARPEVLAARFNARAQGERHPGHLDPATMTAAKFVARGWLECPDYRCPVIAVDTSDFAAVDVGAIVGRLHEALAADESDA